MMAMKGFQREDQRIVLYCPQISWTSRMAGLLRNFSIRRCSRENGAGVDKVPGFRAWFIVSCHLFCQSCRSPLYSGFVGNVCGLGCLKFGSEYPAISETVQNLKTRPNSYHSWFAFDIFTVCFACDCESHAIHPARLGNHVEPKVFIRNASTCETRE